MYEIWSTTSRNLIDYFDTLAELGGALREMGNLDGIAVAERGPDGTTTWLDATAYFAEVP